MSTSPPSSRLQMTGAVPAGCGAISTSCRPATSAIAWWRSRRTKRSFEALPISLRGRPRTQGPQLRQPLPDCAHPHHRRLPRGREAVLRNALAIWAAFIPSTTANVVLEAELEDGTIVSRRDAHQPEPPAHPPDPSAPARRCSPLPETLEAIAQADLITFGPGSLVHQRDSQPAGLGRSRRRSGSRPALKAYFVNLMWQPGETIDFRASDHVRAIQRHAGGNLLDFAVVNTAPISPALRKRMRARMPARWRTISRPMSKNGSRSRQGELLRKGRRFATTLRDRGGRRATWRTKGRLRRTR